MRWIPCKSSIATGSWRACLVVANSRFVDVTSDSHYDYSVNRKKNNTKDKSNYASIDMVIHGVEILAIRFRQDAQKYTTLSSFL